MPSVSGDSEIKKLAVKNLSAYYLTENGPIKAVDAVSFVLAQHESLGIVGESACGKSTLGSALMRSMQKPGKIIGGSILLSGEDVANMTDREFDSNVRWKKIAMVFQGAMNALDPVYTIGSQVRELLEEHGVDGDLDAIVSASLRQVGLEPTVASRYPHELSGGMKQRVVIAMALLLEPELLIADEPTTALDVLVQSQIIALLNRLQKEKGVTVIMISHDLALVSQIADKMGIMYAGQLVEVGTTLDIYKNPKHPYTQALMSAVPRLRSNEKKIQFIPGSPPPLLESTVGCKFIPRCPHAMEMCKRDPPAFETATGYVRCWLYDPTLKNTLR